MNSGTWFVLSSYGLGVVTGVGATVVYLAIRRAARVLDALDARWKRAPNVVQASHLFVAARERKEARR